LVLERRHKRLGAPMTWELSWMSLIKSRLSPLETAFGKPVIAGLGRNKELIDGKEDR
jgi:hypothetical protein